MIMAHANDSDLAQPQASFQVLDWYGASCESLPLSNKPRPEIKAPCGNPQVLEDYSKKIKTSNNKENHEELGC